MADGAYGEYAYGDAESSGSAAGATASAAGTSSAVSQSGSIAASAGNSTVIALSTGPSYAGVGNSVGSSTVAGYSVSNAVNGVGAASGSSTATATTSGNKYAYFSVIGTSSAIAVSPTKARFISAGSSSASFVGQGVCRVLGPFAGVDEQINNETYASRVESPLYCSRIRPSTFAAGPSGSYSYNPTPGENHCGIKPTPPDPFPPLVYTWKPKSLLNARVVDLNAAGNLILIGRGGPLFGGDSLVYLSSDRGDNWTLMPLSGDGWVNVTMNAAGNLMAAYPLDTQYTYSSFDAGASWVASPRPWTTNQTNGVEIAKDGSRTILTANPGNLIYLSNNNGISWQSKDTGLLPWYEFFTCCCASFNNSVMFAGRSLDKMYRSLNGGALWQVCSNSFASQFSKVACDWSGTYVIATSQSTTTWWQVSRDGGQTWTKYGAGSPYLTCAVSGNGRVMAAATYGGYLFLSTDFGLTWTNVNVDGAGSTYLWTDIGINYDGTTIVACAVDGPLYIATA